MSRDWSCWAKQQIHEQATAAYVVQSVVEDEHTCMLAAMMEGISREPLGAVYVSLTLKGRWQICAHHAT